MKKHKRITVTALLILCLTLSLMLSACSFHGEVTLESGIEGTVSLDESAPENAESATAETTEQVVSGEMTSYKFTIKDMTLTQDADGKDAALVTIDFTNNSTEETSFSYVMLALAEQNGESLEPANMTETQETQLKMVAIGETIEVKAGFLLKDKTTALDVLVRPMSGVELYSATKTFKLEA